MTLNYDFLAEKHGQQEERPGIPTLVDFARRIDALEKGDWEVEPHEHHYYITSPRYPSGSSYVRFTQLIHNAPEDCEPIRIAVGTLDDTGEEVDLGSVWNDRYNTPYIYSTMSALEQAALLQDILDALPPAPVASAQS